jgi:hypothetical protein
LPKLLAFVVDDADGVDFTSFVGDFSSNKLEAFGFVLVAVLPSIINSPFSVNNPLII